jgi:two-component system, OmpR family, KDP operon response regulator KdpE
MRSIVLLVQAHRGTSLETAIARDYDVRTAQNLDAAVAMLRASRPALVVVDEASVLDAIELCRHVRFGSSAPIIVLASDATMRSEVAALDAGADDYIGPPFQGDRVRAKIRAVLRRSETDDAAALSVGEVAIDFDRRRIYIHDRPVRLTPKEFDLFVFMARRPNRVLSHQALLEAVWGRGFVEHSEYLRVFVGQLRKKIEPDPENPRYLVTEPWVGYRFDPPGFDGQRPALTAARPQAELLAV